MSSRKISVATLETTSSLNIAGDLVIGKGATAANVTNAKFRKTFEGNQSSGNEKYETAGTFSFVVPDGVIKISALAVGGGGGGAQTWANDAAGGGGMAWADDIPVTAGETIQVTVANRAAANTAGQTSSVGGYLSATGGRQSGTQYGIGVAGTASDVTINRGGSPYSTSWSGGGGGAAGYTGRGGNGYYGGSGATPYNGSGGGGAGGCGYDSSTYGFGGGGGVGIDGEGASGTWGNLSGQSTQPQNNGNSWYSDFRYVGMAGSGGEHGAPNNNSYSTSNKGRSYGHGSGGDYGGGGAGAGSSMTNNGGFGNGGQGACRIAWSTNNSFSIAES